MCDKSVEYGICCDLCQKWYHFKCVSLSDDDIEKFQDTDLQYMCISCSYENRCQMLDDSILYTQTGIAEVGEETHPKTLDRSIGHFNDHTLPRYPVRADDEPYKFSNLGVVSPSQRQAESNNTKQSCIPCMIPMTKGSNQPRVEAQNICTKRLEILSDASLVSNNAGGWVTIGSPNAKIISSQHQGAGSLDVQAGDIPKVKELREKQENICKVQKGVSSAGTGLEQTRVNNSR